MEEIRNIGNLTLKQFKEICKDRNGRCMDNGNCPLFDFCEYNGFGTSSISPDTLYIPEKD